MSEATTPQNPVADDPSSSSILVPLNGEDRGLVDSIAGQRGVSAENLIASIVHSYLHANPGDTIHAEQPTIPPRLDQTPPQIFEPNEKTVRTQPGLSE